MTLSTTNNTVSYTGDPSTVAFSFPYLFYANGDLKVTIDGVLRTLDGAGTYDYTVTGAGSPSGGTVTINNAPDDLSVVIQRIVSYDQQTDLENFDGNPADVTEKQFDLIVMQTQQLAEAATRAISVPVGYDGETPDAFELLETVTDAAAQTAADREQTGLDRIATAADRAQTALDVIATAASASAASASATNAFNYSVLAASTFTATSTSSVSIGTGSKSFTVQTNKGFQAGQPIRASNGVNVMDGTVTSYDNATGALVTSMTSTSGSGTFTSWNISIIGSPGSSGSGSGTVTSFAFTNGNGIAGVVTNATSTPTLVLALQNISPTGINCTNNIVAGGTVTGSNLSGTNTGDQTTITGNAGTATKLATARKINGVDFDGTTNITIPSFGIVNSQTKTDTATNSGGSNTWADTGLSITITPQSSSSKFLLETSVGISGSGGGMGGIRFVRDGSPIGVGDSASSRTLASAVAAISSSSISAVSANYLDQPATASSVTYKVQFAANVATSYVNKSGTDSNSADFYRSSSFLTITEIL